MRLCLLSLMHWGIRPGGELVVGVCYHQSLMSFVIVPVSLSSVTEGLSSPVSTD